MPLTKLPERTAELASIVKEVTEETKVLLLEMRQIKEMLFEINRRLPLDPTRE
jgi:hypothetical protein